MKGTRPHDLTRRNLLGAFLWLHAPSTISSANFWFNSSEIFKSFGGPAENSNRCHVCKHNTSASVWCGGQWWHKFSHSWETESGAGAWISRLFLRIRFFTLHCSCNKSYWTIIWWLPYESGHYLLMTRFYCMYLCSVGKSVPPPLLRLAHHRLPRQSNAPLELEMVLKD